MSNDFFPAVLTMRCRTFLFFSFVVPGKDALYDFSVECSGTMLSLVPSFYRWESMSHSEHSWKIKWCMSLFCRGGSKSQASPKSLWGEKKRKNQANEVIARFIKSEVFFSTAHIVKVA